MANCKVIQNRGNRARLHCNIASAKEYLLFILDVAEFILSSNNEFKEIELSPCSIHLEDIVICNERLFCFVTKNKYFSVNFPININEKQVTLNSATL